MFDLFFRVGPALQILFELGYEMKDHFFYELTCEQYEAVEKEGMDISKKLLTILPDNPADESEHFLCVDEGEKDSLLDAVKYVERMCEKESCSDLTFKEKLTFCASKIPPIFSQGTPFEQIK